MLSIRNHVGSQNCTFWISVSFKREKKKQSYVEVKYCLAYVKYLDSYAK